MDRRDQTGGVQFDPRPWRPPKDLGLIGDFAVNDRLREAALWDTGGVGPEDVAIDGTGRVATGLADGRIVRFPADGGTPETVANTGGRPLGIELHPSGDGYVVCDAHRGLLQVTEGGGVEVLASEHRGRRFALTNNAVVARDGAIYFSVSSHRWGLEEYAADLLEHSGTGVVYRRDPSGDLDVVCSGLVFPNGVALSPRDEHLLVAELGRYRIIRVPLTGDRAGSVGVFRDNLPGFPDNLSQTGGVFWCAFPRTRDRLLDATLPRPWSRRVIHAMPARLQPNPSRHGFVVAFDHDGRVVANLQDPTGRVAVTTGAVAFGRTLVVSSLSEPTVAVVTLPSFLA